MACSWAKKTAIVAGAMAKLSPEGLLRRSASPIAVLATLVAIICLSGCLEIQSRPSMRQSVTVLPSNSAPLRTFSQWLDENQVAQMTRAQWAAIARRSSVVVLNSWNYGLIPVLKRANPDVRVWMYKNLSGIRSDDCTTPQGRCGECHRGVRDSKFLSSGMGYCWTLRHHPRWLLRSSATGLPYQFRHYPDIWETDYGSHAYQRRWIRNVLADVRDHGWDGVAVDNALTTADAYGPAEKYPSDTSVQAATYSALQVTGTALRQAGIGSVFNVGYASRFPGLWQRWLRPVGGLEQEFYLAPSAGSSAIDAAWRAYELEIATCAALRKSCFFKPAEVPVSGTSQYALTSYLIAASGQQLIGVENIATLRGRCWRLGAPQGRGQQLGPAWRRFFKRGVALVNPTSEPVTVPLRGSYVDKRGRAVGEVTLQPASGAVLRTSSSGPLGLTGHRWIGPALC